MKIMNHDPRFPHACQNMQYDAATHRAILAKEISDPVPPVDHGLTDPLHKRFNCVRCVVACKVEEHLVRNSVAENFNHLIFFPERSNHRPELIPLEQAWQTDPP